MTKEKSIHLDSVFAEIRVLFPAQRQTDPIEAFIRQIQGKDRSGRKRDQKIQIIFGTYLEGEEILVLPTNEPRSFSGSELARFVAESYNRDYWLFALWNKMLKNAAGSSLAREIVRAIVKHCIFLTAEEIGKLGRPVDTAFLKAQKLDNRISFYKRMFDWGCILHCMREPYKSRVRERLRHSNDAVLARKISTISFTRLGKHLTEINLILGSSNLPEIVETAKEQMVNIDGILRTIYLKSLFWHDSRQLRNAIKKLIHEEIKP